MGFFRLKMGNGYVLGVALCALWLAIPMFSKAARAASRNGNGPKRRCHWPAATVTVADTLRGVTRTLTTDQAGEYLAPDLLPGTYTIRAVPPGLRLLRRAACTGSEAGHSCRSRASAGRPGADGCHHRRSSANRNHQRHLGRHSEQMRRSMTCRSTAEIIRIC